MTELTVERLKQRFAYDEETGAFTVLKSYPRKKKSSVLLPPGNKKYGQIRIDGKSYLMHRLAWFFVHGKWPEFLIDHKFGNSNAISNLRDVTDQINCQNRQRTKTGSSSGLLGVTWYKPRSLWRTKITVNGKSIHIGYFKCKHAAYEAYINKKRQLHAGCVV